MRSYLGAAVASLGFLPFGIMSSRCNCPLTNAVHPLLAYPCSHAAQLHFRCPKTVQSPVQNALGKIFFPVLTLLNL